MSRYTVFGLHLLHDQRTAFTDPSTFTEGAFSLGVPCGHSGVAASYFNLCGRTGGEKGGESRKPPPPCPRAQDWHLPFASAVPPNRCNASQQHVIGLRYW